MTERCVTLEDLKAMKDRGELKTPKNAAVKELPSEFWDGCKKR